MVSNEIFFGNASNQLRIGNYELRIEKYPPQNRVNLKIL